MTTSSQLYDVIIRCPCCNGSIKKCTDDYGGRGHAKELLVCRMCARTFTVSGQTLMEWPKKTGDVKYVAVTYRMEISSG